MSIHIRNKCVELNQTDEMVIECSSGIIFQGYFYQLYIVVAGRKRKFGGRRNTIQGRTGIQKIILGAYHPRNISALQSVTHKNSNNPITVDILLKYNDLYNHHNIMFCWIPIHVRYKRQHKSRQISARLFNFLYTSYSDSIFRCSPYSSELHPYHIENYFAFLPKQ